MQTGLKLKSASNSIILKHTSTFWIRRDSEKVSDCTMYSYWIHMVSVTNSPPKCNEIMESKIKYPSITMNVTLQGKEDYMDLRKVLGLSNGLSKSGRNSAWYIISRLRWDIRKLVRIEAHFIGLEMAESREMGFRGRRSTLFQDPHNHTLHSVSRILTFRFWFDVGEELDSESANWLTIDSKAHETYFSVTCEWE